MQPSAYEKRARRRRPLRSGPVLQGRGPYAACVLAAHLVSISLGGCGGLVLEEPAQGTRDDDDGGEIARTDASADGGGLGRDEGGAEYDGAGLPNDGGVRHDEAGSDAGDASASVCGDGIVTGTELCDDGNTDDGDTCPSTCRRELWSKRFGDVPGQQTAGLAVDSTGAAIITGTYQGTLDFGGGPLPSAGLSSVFIAKLDAAGKHLWSRKAGATGQDDRAFGVAIDPAGNVVVTGVFSGTIDLGGGPLVSAGSWDVFVVKLDAAGNHLWSKRFGDSAQQQPAGVSIDAAGNVVVAGMFWGTVDFGGGPLTSAGSHDIFVAKLDPTGNHVWSRRFGDTAGQGARSVAVSGSGDVFVTGECAGTVDFGGGPLAPTGDGDAFLLALDAAGQHRWSKRWGAGNQYQAGTGVTVDPAGDVLVTGYCQGTTDLGTGALPGKGYLDVFLGKFNPMGGPIFARRFGSVRNDVPLAIATDGAGHVLLTGYYEGPIDFGNGPLAHTGARNTFVAKLDTSGALVWSSGYGTSATGTGIAADTMGNVFAAGYFSNKIDFGGGALVSAGGASPADDVFLAKLAP